MPIVSDHNLAHLMIIIWAASAQDSEEGVGKRTENNDSLLAAVKDYLTLLFTNFEQCAKLSAFLDTLQIHVKSAENIGYIHQVGLIWFGELRKKPFTDKSYHRGVCFPTELFCF